jgi:hypothetical protein
MLSGFERAASVRVGWLLWVNCLCDAKNAARICMLGNPLARARVAAAESLP